MFISTRANFIFSANQGFLAFFSMEAFFWGRRGFWFIFIKLFLFLIHCKLSRYFKCTMCLKFESHHITWQMHIYSVQAEQSTKTMTLLFSYPSVENAFKQLLIFAITFRWWFDIVSPVREIIGICHQPQPVLWR